MRLTLIAALGPGRLIGKDGGLPWRLPADLRRFKALTVGHVVVMGRKTYESIGRPLPNRRNLVLSRDPSFAPDGVEVFRSLDLALSAVAAAAAAEVFVIGGAAVYREALPRADRLELTQVDGSFEGDVFFPEFDESEWRETFLEAHAPDDANPHPHVFRTLERTPSS